MQEIPTSARMPMYLSDFVTTPIRPLDATLAHIFSIPRPLITSSPTIALMLGLKVLYHLNSSRNTVVIPAYTSPAIPMLQSKLPWLRFDYCDLSEDGFDFDHEMLQKMCGKHTLAIVATHLGGRIANMSFILEFAKECGAYVVEDGTYAMGATYDGKSIGMSGDIGFFGFSDGKGLIKNDCGAVFSKDKKINILLRSEEKSLKPAVFSVRMRKIFEVLGYATFSNPQYFSWFYTQKLHKAILKKNDVMATFDNLKEQDVTPSAYPELSSRAMANSLRYFSNFINSCAKRAEIRLKVFEDAGINVIRDYPGGVGVWPLFIIRMPSSEARDAALDLLWESGLGVSRLYARSILHYPDLRKYTPHAPACPNAEAFARETLTVTNSHWLNRSSFQTIVDVLKSMSDK